MVDARLEQFHGKDNALFFGNGSDAAQALDAIGETFFRRFALDIARKTDQGGNVVRASKINICEDFVFNAVVIFSFVEPVGQGSVADDDGDVEPVVFDQ